MLIHNADITGSLTINGVPYTTGSYTGIFIAGTNIMSANTVSLTGSFTGSFFGDGSQLSGVTSYTDADTLDFIQGYSGSYSGSFSGSFFGDGSNLSGVTSYTDADTLDFINSLNVVSGSIQTVSTVSDTFTSVTSYTVTHNFGTKEVIVSVYENDTLIFPSSITTPTVNTVTITFPEPITGRVVVVKAGHIVSGSINYSNVLNKPTLVSGSSQISFTGITNKPTLVSGSSQITYSGLTGIPSGIVSGSTQISQFGYATTGSNQFKANQTITGSLTVTGAIVAQTLNVQQVTSSVVFSSGSNRFGNNTSNTHQFTGSVNISGSLTTSIATLGSTATTFLTSDGGTIRSRTAAQTLSDIAALPLAGGTLTGALNGTSAVFSGNVLLGGASATNPLSIRTADGESYIRFLNANGTTYGDLERSITGAGAVRFTGANFRFTAGAEVVGALTGNTATFSSSVTAGGNAAFNTTSAVSGYALDVRGATNKRFGVANSNAVSGAQLVFFTDANAFADGYIDASKLILQSGTGGNVGIGTATPQGRVESKTATVFAGDAIYSKKAFVANIPYSTANLTSTLLAGFDGTIHGTDIGYSYDGTGYYLALATNHTTSGNPTERMRITSVGITQLKPASGELALEIFNGATSTGAILGDANDFYVGSQTGKGLRLCTNNLGNTRMFISVAGNVGIGTATPTDFGSTYKVLSIDGAGGGGVLDLMNGGTRSLSLGVDSSEPSISSRINGNPIVFRTNSGGTVTERMRITSGGKIEMGNTSISGEVAKITGTTGVDNYLSVYSGTIHMFLDADATNSAGIVGTQSSHNLILRTAGTNKVFITTGGNVGIGTTAPNEKLTVWTSSTTGLQTALRLNNPFGFANTNTGAQIVFSQDRSTAENFVQGVIAVGQATPGTSTTSYMSFSTNNTGVAERMRISSGGSVGIGTAGQAAVKLEVKGGGTGNTNYSAVFTDSNSQDLFFLRTDGLINTGTRAASPYNNSTSGRTMVIESNGTLGYTSSTRESKINIESITNVSWLYDLNPVSFNYRKKDDEMNYTEEYHDEKYYGLIADEVESINENLVFYNIKEDGAKELAGVEYQKITSALVKAIQEQQEQINQLKNQIK